MRARTDKNQWNVKMHINSIQMISFRTPRPALSDLLSFFLRVGGGGGGGGGEKRSDHIKRWAIMSIIMLGIRFNVVFLYSSY